MFKKYKKILAILGSMLLIVGVFKFSTKNGGDMALEVTLDESKLIHTEIVVHVDGAVASPGLYKLKSGNRLGDAIEMAGGVLDTANTELINYASILEDGQKITILHKKRASETKENLNEYVKSESVPLKDKLNTETPIYQREDYSVLEKINYMTVEDFQLVPGIGEKISQSIITYREEIGYFNDINDLKEVTGIGEAKFNKILVFLNVSLDQ